VSIWFFIGDSFDWLESHKRVSGVTRVTVELFFAAFSKMKNFEHVVPCVLARSADELASVDLADTLGYLALKLGKAKGLVVPLWGKTSPPERWPSPKSVDHALFTGVVWTPQYIELFHRLDSLGIGFSVLVHDIIPIEWPDLTTDEHHRIFVEWLKTVVMKAQIIFVSSQATKDQIYRWAALVGVDVVARIASVAFGSTELGSTLTAQDPADNTTTSQVNSNSFVLSVGTIDRRKNQTLLYKVWCRLISELGEDRVPQLVLAGRNDLKSKLDVETTHLINESNIVILENLSDAELSGLYRDCLFTVFPSLSEGYGLPVAESLQHGKLCLASGLTTIKEHAGDLPWYFDPTVEKSAYDVIRRAIERTDLRAETEQRIQQLYRPRSWTSTFQSIAEAIESDRCQRRGTASRSVPEDSPILTLNASLESGVVNHAFQLNKGYVEEDADLFRTFAKSDVKGAHRG
jgi:glycosyltransferase involved in cell wall biosynthesis